MSQVLVSPANRPWLARLLPFADKVLEDLPLARLFRLSLFQVSVGLASVMLIGTLNRVMIVELKLAAWLVSLMVALPIVLAPWRALIGFRSDTYQSKLGWRRVPFIWIGTLLQFGGLAIMPFALLVLAGFGTGPSWVGQVGAALAFLLVGAGMQTVQTTGLALATDLTQENSRPHVVALMYVMLLVGMLVGGLSLSALLSEFSQIRLVQVVQGSAVVTLLLNMFALWKQEPRGQVTRQLSVPPKFSQAWQDLIRNKANKRFLWAVSLGTAGISMQDIILEPYGAQVLGMSVSATTGLTALWACGGLLASLYCMHALKQGTNAYRLAAFGVLTAIAGFAGLIFAAPLESAWTFRTATLCIGFGSALFTVAMLGAAMIQGSASALTGLSLGAWGTAQTISAGIAMGLGGLIRDAAASAAEVGLFGASLNQAATAYSMVYHIEILLLFLSLVALGPLVRSSTNSPIEFTPSDAYPTRR